MRSILSLKKIAPAVVALPLVMSIFVLITPPQKAQAAAVTSCALVVRNKACLKDIKQCTSLSPDRKDDCIKAKIAKYTPVYAACRDRANPQTCHNSVKAKCKGKTGAALTECRKTAAAKFGKKKPPKVTTNESVSLSGTGEKQYQCGGDDDAVETRFDFGCQGEGGPIEDLAYSLIRFLSVGVGLVLAASIIYAGIQYSSSEGSPEATQAAKKRIQNAITGLVFYLFIFALVQYLVPGGLFN